MMRLIYAFPGDLQTQSGGYAYARRVIPALNDAGLETLAQALPGDFPNPGAADIAAAVAILNQVAQKGDVVLVDGLALGVMPAEAIRAIGAPVIALCHHPLGLEAGLTPERSRVLLDSERQAFAAAAHVVTTSSYIKTMLMRDFAVPGTKISTATPGADRVSPAIGSSGPLSLLAVSWMRSLR
jgi:hypothetical protein